jgi:DNA-binding response OmpR family regulator
VLLVTEDAHAGPVWAYALAQAGVQAALARSAAEAVCRWGEHDFDAILLDVCSDWAHGLRVIRDLRARGAGPILVLCPHAGESHAVAAYAAGADECIAKPVSAAILVAKVRAWLRRRRTIRTDSLLPLEAGGLRLEPARQEVRLAGGAAVPLTGLELRLLYLLMSNPGLPLAADVILSRLWDGGDVALIKRTVRRLRAKIEANPARPRLIRTVRGQGYAFAV